MKLRISHCSTAFLIFMCSTIAFAQSDQKTQEERVEQSERSPSLTSQPLAGESNSNEPQTPSGSELEKGSALSQQQGDGTREVVETTKSDIDAKASLGSAGTPKAGAPGVVPSNWFNPSNWSDSTITRVAKFSVIAFVAAFVFVLIAGVTNNIVIWYDRRDFYVSLLMVLTGLIGPMIGYVFFRSDTPILYTILIGSGLIVLALCVLTVWLSIHYNRGVVIGLIVGMFKVLIAIFTLLLIWFMLGQKDGRRRYDDRGQVIYDPEQSRNAASTALQLGLFAGFLYLLINGERVYAKKGWTANTRSASTAT